MDEITIPNTLTKWIKIFMKKYITTHSFGNDNRKVWCGNAYIVANHYNHSLTSFQELVAEARKDFPDLKDEDVECRTVAKSPSCLGMPFIYFPCPPHTKKTGWQNCDRLNF